MPIFSGKELFKSIEFLWGEIVRNRKAQVYYKGRYAGILKEDEYGGFQFTYDPLYLVDGYPIAYTIPLSNETFTWAAFPPFFEGLASEGWLRRVQCKTQQIDERDSFGLLLANGRDTVGAVTLFPLENEG